MELERREVRLLVIDKPLADCTNFELMQILVPDLQNLMDRAQSDNPELLQEIDRRQTTTVGFRPFACFGGFH
ncbi:MAG: hypothetical protein QG665_318 [Patescibacteria group bacterium]|nr:hypothetical protein [Patescibacteria group bacterium]